MAKELPRISTAEREAELDRLIDEIDPATAARPTDYPPGTCEKLAILHHRWQQGLPMWPDGDSQGDLE